MRNNSGHVFPTVLFYTAAIFLLIQTTIQMYLTEIRITNNMIEQLNTETLLQMSLQEVRQEYDTKRPNINLLNKTYRYPHGTVKAELIEVSSTRYKAVLTAKTSSGKGTRSISSTVIVPPPPITDKNRKRKEDKQTDKEDIIKNEEDPKVDNPPSKTEKTEEK